jgi:hypothetical protein
MNCLSLFFLRCRGPHGSPSLPACVRFAISFTNTDITTEAHRSVANTCACTSSHSDRRTSGNPRPPLPSKTAQPALAAATAGTSTSTTALLILQISSLAFPCQKTLRKPNTRCVCDLARYYRRSPELISYEEVTGWLQHLIKERQLAASSIHIAVSAVRFLYAVTLGRERIDLVTSART